MGIQKRNTDLGEINGASDDSAIVFPINDLRKRGSHLESGHNGNGNGLVGNIGGREWKRDWNLGSGNNGNGNNGNENLNVGNSKTENNKETNVGGIGNVGGVRRKCDWNLGSGNNGNDSNGNGNSNVGNLNKQNNKETHVGEIENIAGHGSKCDWNLKSGNNGNFNNTNNNNSSIGNSYADKNKDTKVLGKKLGKVIIGRKLGWILGKKLGWILGNGNNANDTSNIGNAHVENNKDTKVGRIGNARGLGRKLGMILGRKLGWVLGKKLGWTLGSGNNGNGHNANDNSNIGSPYAENNKETNVGGIENVRSLGRKLGKILGKELGWIYGKKLGWILGIGNNRNGHKANDNSNISNSYAMKNTDTNVIETDKVGK
ncbi:myb-like protein D [Mytilus trossulus]|uniref:myb-like protein D n=1 Tax=Mytilus trossulus TaxID=6551 RepID=UPI003007133A